MQDHRAHVTGGQEENDVARVASKAGAAPTHDARPRGSATPRARSANSAAPSSMASTAMATIGRTALRMAVYLTTRMECAS